MSNRLFIALCLSLVLLPGCDKKKTPLVGERETVLVSDAPLKPHSELAGKKLHLAPVQVQRNWDQPGGCCAHNTHVALADGTLKKKWKVSVSSENNNVRRLVSPPIVHNDIIYLLNTEGYVVAHDIKDGKRLWKVDIRPRGESGGGLGGGVSYHQDHLFVTTPYAEVLCIDAATQKIVWRKELLMPSRAAPTVYHNRLFVLTIGNELSCLDSQTGETAWTHRGMLETAGLLGTTNVAIAGSVVVAPYTSGEVYGLHVETGEPLWSENLASFGRVDSIALLPHIHARPAIQNDIAYLVSHSGRSAAIDIKTGLGVWEQNFGGSESPVVSGNAIFILTLGQVLVCLDKDTGSIRWSSELQRFENPENPKEYIVWKGPVLAGQKLVLTSSHGHLQLIDAFTGKTLQDIQMGQKTSIEPIVVNNTIYVLTDKGYLLAYQP